MTNLLSCPFCGGDAVHKYELIECSQCGCVLHGDYFHEPFPTYEDAIAAWNRRTPPQPADDSKDG